MSTCTPLKCHRTSSSGFQHPGILQVKGLLEARSFRIAVSSHTRQVLHPGCSLVPTVCYGCATQSVPQIVPSSAPRAPCSRMHAALHRESCNAFKILSACCVIVLFPKT